MYERQFAQMNGSDVKILYKNDKFFWQNIRQFFFSFFK